MTTIAKNFRFTKTWGDTVRDYAHHFDSLEHGGGAPVVVSDGALYVGAADEVAEVDVDEAARFLREYVQDAADNGVEVSYQIDANVGAAIMTGGELVLIGTGEYDGIPLELLMETLDVTVTYDTEKEPDAVNVQANRWLGGHGAGTFSSTPRWSQAVTIVGGAARTEAYVLDTRRGATLHRFTHERGHESATLTWQPATD